jgi:hypothetical protein
VVQAEAPGVKMEGWLGKTITKEDLVSAETMFNSGSIEREHGDAGGDRMSAQHHNYSPIYSKYLTNYLEKGHASAIAEVGILTGTGLAMWSKLFPGSNVFGFDINTNTYKNNVAHMRKLGFDDSRVKVTQMDQMQDNSNLLQQAFGELRPQVVIDDGYHVPEAGLNTFLSMKPILADRFVYFIEDLIASEIEKGGWDSVKEQIMKSCPDCEFAFECPAVADKPECIAVIHNMKKHLGSNGDIHAPQPLLSEIARQRLSQHSGST